MATSFEQLKQTTLLDRAIGVILGLIILCTILANWEIFAFAAPVAKVLSVIAVLALTPSVKNSRRIFVVVALALCAYAFLFYPTPWAVISEALGRASFIIAFFSALATLRHVAGISEKITRAAVYLASQPPGRRYSALTIGTQAFAPMLNYGAISLLGGMSRASSDREPDPEIRKIRIRRMLQAVHRGFAASLCWSPLGFAMVISTSIVQGAELNHIILPALVSSAILIGVGWAMDQLFKPVIPQGHHATPLRDSMPTTARDLLPVLWLILLIAIPAVILDLTAGLPAAMSVLMIIPLLSAGWLLIGAPRRTRLNHAVLHACEFGFIELPSYRNEIVLLSMAGFIGSSAGTMLAPIVAGSGLDLAAMPVWLLLILPIVLIPIGGQLGMNPILFVSLFGPLLPTPEALGISPTAMVLSITAGWSLSGVTSPFTASVMLVARLGDVTPATVSLRWNGAYSAVCAVMLALWLMFWI
ncbi:MULTISPECIES: hypothetical protein [Thioclava]|uniref:H+/citrate symporter n=1 Tax=Thioclava litoralis TaxID=3076557 RepID=A0ABZ1E0K6_9RHOB|nr:hypothetical protein RPE78_01040 [Thioclava sp. FTW29]